MIKRKQQEWICGKSQIEEWTDFKSLLPKTRIHLEPEVELGWQVCWKPRYTSCMVRRELKLRPKRGLFKNILGSRCQGEDMILGKGEESVGSRACNTNGLVTRVFLGSDGISMERAGKQRGKMIFRKVELSRIYLRDLGISPRDALPHKDPQWDSGLKRRPMARRPI